MRIISKFKDYYDTAMGLGMDSDVIYIRDKKIVFGQHDAAKDFPKKYEGFKYQPPSDRYGFYRSLYIPETSRKDSSRPVYFVSTTVFFCGKAYRAISVVEMPGRVGEEYRDVEQTTFYSLESLYSFLREKGYKEPGGKWNPPDIVKNRISALLSSQISPSVIQGLVEDRVICACFREHHNSHLCSRYSVVENCNLSELQFYKVFSPSEAYQEIAMYISGVLGNLEKETITISDKDRIHAHGFNERSFRKDPTKRKV